MPQFSADGGRRERLARVRPGKVEARAAEPQPKDLAFAITPFDLRLASRNAALEEEEVPQRAASVVAAPSQPSMSSPRSDTLTKLVAFSTSFPYEGLVPGGGPFLNVRDGEQRGLNARNALAVTSASSIAG